MDATSFLRQANVIDSMKWLVWTSRGCGYDTRTNAHRPPYWSSFYVHLQHASIMLTIPSATPGIAFAPGWRAGTLIYLLHLLERVWCFVTLIEKRPSLRSETVAAGKA